MLAHHHHVTEVLGDEDDVGAVGGSEDPGGREERPSTVMLVQLPLDADLPGETVGPGLRPVDYPASQVRNVRRDCGLSTGLGLTLDQGQAGEEYFIVQWAAWASVTSVVIL